MKELKVKNGRIELPEEHQLSMTNRRLIVKTSYMSSVETVCKDNFRTSVQQWFRQKGKDKPFIPEGYININGERYKVIEVKE